MPTATDLSACCPSCTPATCPVDWNQVFLDNGGSLFLTLPCPNTPDPLELEYNVEVAGLYATIGFWGSCADDFNNIRLDCESEAGAADPLSNTPQLTGNHGGNPFRVPITITSLNPFFATFEVLPFDGGNTNSNEPCGGCGEDPLTAIGTIEP